MNKTELIDRIAESADLSKAISRTSSIKWMDEVLEIALERMPKPQMAESEFTEMGSAKKKSDDRPPPEGDRPISAH